MTQRLPHLPHRVLGLLACLALLTVAPRAFAQFEDSEPPEWRWHQILSVPRIGSRLRTITVDKEDPRRIFVGTEEGTLLRSMDAGVTWIETEVRPFVMYERSLGLKSPGLPKLGGTTKNNFRVYVDPPWQTFTHRIPIPSVANPFPVKPDFFFAGFLASSPKAPSTFLSNVVRSRSKYTVPVKRVALCPGGNYDVVVATWRDVFGSQDGGDTFVRLFSNPGKTGIYNLTCNPDNPNEIAVATGIGLFVSQDGLTFDQDLEAWPGQRATAVSYGPTPGGGPSRLYSAAGSEMFAGQFGTEAGMKYIYPSGDSSTAPWLPINWIATNKRGDVWLATDDGARFSPDHGMTWKTPARTLMSRQVAYQVELGENEDGGVRIVVMLNVEPMSLRGKAVSALHDSHVYASDDGGNSWHPFFHGLSRRYHYQMASVPSTADHPSGWWIVTSGGVWTTYPAQIPQQVQAEASEWAGRRLATTPGLGIVLDAALDHMNLSNEKIHGLANAHRNLNWVPRLDLLFKWVDNALPQVSDRFDSAVMDPNRARVIRNITEDSTAYVGFLQASWDIKDVLNPHEDLNWVRPAMHTLRRQIAFATEDAWHERQNLLAQLQRLSDPLQIETIKARIEGLEAMLSIWLGQSLEDLHAVKLPRSTP